MALFVCHVILIGAILSRSTACDSQYSLYGPVKQSNKSIDRYVTIYYAALTGRPRMKHSSSSSHDQVNKVQVQ